ncbi:MAG: DNA-packaging protein [Rhodobacteraceae bacterium]|nr:DNA-packaging protein [Paracoccaceae bacterium]
MQSQAEKLADLPKAEQDAFIASLSDGECKALMYDWRGFNARPNQIAPDGDWDIWLALAGRGFGKTRMGAEWVKEKVESGQAKRIALIAETAADARDVLVEGESGLLSIYPDGQGPLYEPSKRRLTWKNGAVATLFNATEPNQLRGPQYDLAWSDELAKWRYARETWDQLQFGLRLGDNPQQIVTTTPRPIEIVKAIIAGREGEVVITRGNTMENASNLAAKFLRKIKLKYEGTRLGRQELNAEILGDIPNALWTLANIDLFRIPSAPETLDRIVVAVDPAITNTDRSDEHGIVACGSLGHEGYVLEDASIKGSPEEWARAAITCYDDWHADCIVVEVNQGGDMVAATIRTIRQYIPIHEVRATRGKHVRAEPISSLYQQGRIHHVGAFVELENQMTMMTSAGYEGEGSPDRLDALVWGMTELFPSMILRRTDDALADIPVIVNDMSF